MALFRLDADLLSLDAEDFDEVADAFMETVMRKAIKAFLKACTKKIPVRTGFMKGSFGGLQRYYGYGDTSGADLNPDLAAIFVDHKLFKEREIEVKDKKLTAAGKIARLKSLRSQKLKSFQAKKLRLKKRGISTSRLRFEEYYYPGGGEKILKTPTSGIQFVTPPEQTLIRRKDVVTFVFRNYISYYQINDFYEKIASAPWGSLEAGRDAMIQSLQRSLRKFPAITEIMGRFRIGLKDSNVVATKTKPNISGLISSMVSRITGSPDA